MVTNHFVFLINFVTRRNLSLQQVCVSTEIMEKQQVVRSDRFNSAENTNNF